MVQAAAAGEGRAETPGRGVGGLKELSNFILAFFRWCLALYPPVFRCEYGEELDLVFELGLQDAATKGRAASCCASVRASCVTFPGRCCARTSGKGGHP